MKKLSLIVLALALAYGSAWAQDTQRTPAYCNRFVQVSQAASAISKVISGAAGQQIQLCGWALSGGGVAASATAFAGTGTNCGTGQTTLQPVVNVPINGTYVDHIPFVNQFLPTGSDLCLTTVGVGPLSVIIYFSQF